MDYEIRAMSLGEILDTGFRILRSHFALLIGIGLFLALPSQMLQFLADPAMPYGVGAVIVLALTVMLVSPVVSAAITHSIGQLYLGHSASIGASYRSTFSIFVPLIGTSVLVMLVVAAISVPPIILAVAVPELMIVVLPVALVPITIVILGFLLLGPVMILERVFGPTALRRSRELMAGQRWRGLAIVIIAGIIQSVLGGVTGVALGFIPLVGALGTAVVQALLYAFSNAAFVVFYFDVRCRKEAFDLEHLAAQVERTAEAGFDPLT